MRSTLLVARVEAQRRVRNRSAVFTAFVGPLLLASVFGLLLGGTSSLSFAIGVVDLDRSELTTAFTAALNDGAATDSPVRFVAIAGDAEARAAIDDGDVDAAIVIPADFGAAVTSGRSAALVVLRDPAKEISGEVARSVADRFATAISTRALAAATVVALGGATPSGDDLLALDDTIASVTDEPPGGNQVDASTFFGTSMSVLFLFFTVSFAARSLIDERRSGIVPRILATPTSPAAVVLGKVLAVSVLGCGGFLTVWGVTSVAFGASWGDPLAVVVTILATVAAIGGVATFVCGLARTAQQADTYASATAFVLAMLGGNFVGPGQAPDALQRLASFTPNGQALDAFTRIAVDEAAITDVGRQLLVLVAIALVFGGVGLIRVGKALRQ